MAENSHISWTDDTFNPWVGCSKISPACDGCYAAELMGDEGRRFKRVIWGGPGKGAGTRDRTAPGNWAKVLGWNRKYSATPGQRFVFCASLADWADKEVPIQWLADLLVHITRAENLTFLLLTKRIGIVLKRVREAMKIAGLTEFPGNAAIGITVVNPKEAARDLPVLKEVKDALRPLFVFLSMEPLLEPVDIRPWLAWIDWVITGGETDQGAHRARPADPDWYRSLRDQCAAAGVPFQFKQWGEWQPYLEQVPTNTNAQPARFGDRLVWRFGKDVDPGTLDGVVHHARPEVAHDST